MYWGADDEVRADADDPKRRLRQLSAALAVTVLSIGGTVAMASASTTHAAAAPPVTAPAAVPHPAFIPKPIVTTTTTTPPPAPPVRPAPPAPAPAPAPKAQAVATAVQTRSTIPAAPALAGADTCSAALAYLGAHSAPGFTFECPGYALGHQAMTCVNVAGVCPGTKLIAISVVCPASYMNEAHNSWIEAGLASGSIDPYGYCH